MNPARPSNPPRPSPFTILIIDDDRLVLSMASDLLTAEGHLVLTASTGEEGLAMARTIRADLILVDDHMPVMNGLDAARALKRIMPAVPLIMYSAFGDRFVEQQARLIGISDVV